MIIKKFKGALLIGSLLFLFIQNIFAFDEKRAYSYLVDQCNLGTRDPGSSGHKKFKVYLEKFLKSKNGIFKKVDFEFRDSRFSKTYPLTNFHFIVEGKFKKKLIFCAHWDTRPWADQDSDTHYHNIPIAGANDGASGVSVLMELINKLSTEKPIYSIEFVFFDGEDFGKRGDNYWCQGSKYFAKTMKVEDYKYAILIDMIGDKNQNIKIEQNSQKSAPFLIKKIWEIAYNKDINTFSTDQGFAIYDDHIPLIEKGLPAIDIIDFDYKYWHTMADTPDKCSEESLRNIGIILEEIMFSY